MEPDEVGQAEPYPWRMQTLSLDGDGWRLRCVTPAADAPDLPDTLEATVPGCVHTDLLTAGLIPDPFVARNDEKVSWVSDCTWAYTLDFEVPEVSDHPTPDVSELCFDGLDTLATVTLNGERLGETKNMHRRYRFDCGAVLRPGSNRLEVRFQPALAYALEQREAYGLLPAHGNGSNPFTAHNFIRKMACSFGWDWGPILIGMGIFRGVRLEQWSGFRLGDLRAETSSISDGHAVLDVDLDVQHAGPEGQAGLSVTVRLVDPQGAEAASAQLDGEGHATLRVDDPHLWWPVGYGEQPLYTLIAEGPDGRSVQRRVGLRTVTLDTSADAGHSPPGGVDGTRPGEAMTLQINHRPVWCRGANFIPDDIFPSRVTPADLRERVVQARDANMNMLRVWGGGLYPEAAFFEVCDELGVMVWQDFLFACAGYPETDAYAAEIEAEATDNLSRLTGHASLVFWNGCNENLWIHHEMDYRGQAWPEWIGDRGWGLKYWFELLPAAVQRLAPNTPYWPGSPSNGMGERDPQTWHPNAQNRGNRHIWDVWQGDGQYRNYLNGVTRFASEFGYHGPPTWPTIRAFVPEGQLDELTFDHPLLEHHNRNRETHDNQQHANNRVSDDFDPPADFADWHYCAQVMQARALDMGVGWFRALHPYCAGALFWQLNDCWPVLSWSALDGLNRRKPLWYAMRRTMAPRYTVLRPARVLDADAGPAADLAAVPLAVFLHNDTAEPWTGSLTLEAWPLDAAEPHQQETLNVQVEPFGCERVDLPASLDRDLPTAATLAGAPTAWWWPRPDKQLAYAPPAEAYRASVEADADGARVTVRADRLVRDLCLFSDRIDPESEASDQAVTLRPGEQTVFEVLGRFPDPEALLKPPVLQCANRFGL